MKKITIKIFLLLLLTIAGISEVKAQAKEFAPVGSEWYYEYQSMMKTGYVHIEAVSDTLIDNVKCTKLTKILYGYDYYDGLFKWTIGNEYVTQTNDSVKIYRNGGFHLLFDFGASIGDTWILIGDNIPCEQSYGLVHVVDIGKETINGQVLKYVKILDDQHSYWGYGNCMESEPCTDTVKIVEKIGPIKSYLLPSQKCVFDYSEGGSLRCYIDNDLGYLNYSWTGVNCGYINEQYQLIDDADEESPLVTYPNPCNDLLHIVLNNDNNTDVFLYDNQGNMVCQFSNIAKDFDIDMSNFPTGLYFLKVIDGLKILTTKIIKK